jgi:integrase
MTRLRLPYIDRYKDRHGKVRHYVRRPGMPRVALPGLPGSAEFMAAYQAAIAGAEAPKARMVGRVLPGSFSALAVAYYRSVEYLQLAGVTKATYRNIIEKFRAEHHDKPIAAMQREHVRRLVAARADKPAAANGLLKMLRILMQFAVNEGMRRDDPTAGVKRIRSKSEGFATWSEDQIAAFAEHWPAGSREHLAFALLLYTGQRRGDVIHMGRQHVRNGAIELRQHKTGERLAVPIHADLRAALDACPSEHLTFLTTKAGSPFTSAGFGNWFADVVRAAGLAGIAAHGLRKAAARRLAEAGCTAHQIAAITGHRTLREVERYTRAADQVSRAQDAMAKLAIPRT